MSAPTVTEAQPRWDDDERWNDGQVWGTEELSTPKSHAERQAEHTAALAALARTRDSTLSAAQREVLRAHTAHDAAARELEDKHRATTRLALRRSREAALAKLVAVVRPWHEEPSRAGTAAIIAAWNECDAEARHATGSALDERTIAFSFAEVFILNDPRTACAFASGEAWSGLVYNLTHAAHHASQALVRGELLAAKDALEQLDRVCTRVAANPSCRLADTEATQKRWDLLKFGTATELEAHDRATEDARQKACMAQLKPLPPKHPTDYSGSLVLTPEIRDRIGAGKSHTEVIAEAQRENAVAEGRMRVERLGP